MEGGRSRATMEGTHVCHLCAHRATTSILGPRPLPIEFIYGFTTSRDIGHESRSRRIHLFLDRRFHPTILSFVPGNKNSIFHGREIFSLDFGTRERPRNKTLRFSSPLKFMRGGFRYRQPHLTDRENWEQPEIRIRGVLHRECTITSSTRCTLSCKYFLSNRNS